MKLRKTAVAVLLTLVLALSLIGCSKGNNGIVGTWVGEKEGESVEFTFNSDGTGAMKLMEMSIDTSYKTEGEKLMLTINFLGMERTQDCTYSVKGDTLKLVIEGETVELKRK
jgi:uncharacterized lipoprotein YehR (DUF1307 family)